MESTYGHINSRTRMAEFTARADKPNRAVIDFGIVVGEADARDNPKTEFLLYILTPEVPQWAPNNPYWQRYRAVVKPTDYIGGADTPIKYSDATIAWAILPSIDLARRIAEVVIARFREVPTAFRTIYLDNMWQVIPNWAWPRIEAKLATMGINRDYFNALLRVYEHELVIRLRRAGIKIVANTAKWADPLFDEITLEHERPGKGGIDAPTAMGLFVKQQEYVPGSIGTLWYAPVGFSAPRLAQGGTWE